MTSGRAHQSATLWNTLLSAALLAASGCVRSAGNGESSAGARPGAASSAPTSRRASDAKRTYPLDSLPVSSVTINGHVLRVWLARELDPQRPDVVQEGLMHVPAEEIADDQGMLFVFSDERVRGFWMLNTITPLDIAFARANGTIVQTHQMPPRTLRTFSSVEPAMFALETKQGTFDRLGIRVGDRMEIPSEVFGSER
jgi:hypothetical protein